MAELAKLYRTMAMTDVVAAGMGAAPTRVGIPPPVVDEMTFWECAAMLGAHQLPTASGEHGGGVAAQPDLPDAVTIGPADGELGEWRPASDEGLAEERYRMRMEQRARRQNGSSRNEPVHK